MYEHAPVLQGRGFGVPPDESARHNKRRADLREKATTSYLEIATLCPHVTLCLAGCT